MTSGGNLVLAAAAIGAVCCAPAAARESAAPCLRVVNAVARGEVPVARDVSPAACPADPGALPLRYDPAAKALRATRDLSVGETLPPTPFALPTIRAGDRLVLAARIGAVTVERQVIALQLGQAGAPVFVKAADGTVFAATFPEIAR